MARLTLLIALFLPLGLRADGKDYRQISYLISTHQVEKALENYLSIHEEKQKHDYQVLQQLGMSIIEEGCKSPEHEDQLLSLFGMAISENQAPNYLLYDLIRSQHPLVQSTTLRIAADMFEDSSEQLLMKALTSNYFMIRLEALYYLTARHSQKAFGQIQSIQSLLPEIYHPYFGEFYALDKTSYSLTELKKMIHHHDPKMRLAGILSVIKYRVEDLKETIFPILSQKDPVELEAAAFAVGMFQDLTTTNDLKNLLSSSQIEVKLAALHALTKLGYTDYITQIETFAKEGNLFAISILGELGTGEKVLKEALNSSDLTLRLNAALALLHQRNADVVPYLLDIFAINKNSYGIQAFPSPGQTMSYWNIVPLKALKDEKAQFALASYTRYILEIVLSECLELGEKPFLQIASYLMARQHEWILPKLTRLIENIRSPDAIQLLEEKSQQLGAPLIRAYATLGLYRLGNDIDKQEALIKWILREKQTELIRFRPVVDQSTPKFASHSPYQLTPEETSGFLIEAISEVAQKRQESSISYLIMLMKDGNPKNRYALAGLLLRTIQ